MSIIRLRNISVSFGGPAILQNISLSIDVGERVCLLGRNGMGKSTLMKVIAGDIVPDSGEIERQQGRPGRYCGPDVQPSHRCWRCWGEGGSTL